jgi:polyisoprenoid-binding protein YceI
MTLSSIARRRDVRLLAAIVAVAGLAGGAYGLWTIFLKPAGPGAVSASLLAAPSASAGGTSTSSPIATGTHTLTVDTSLGSFSDFSSSFVGYRVQEELASIGGNTAVGRTADASGTVTIEGMTVTAAEITADLSTLKSDDDRRDSQLQRQALETDQYPTATFSLTKPIELPAAAAQGEAVNVTATGDFTLHGVTKSVQIPLQARLETDRVVLIGSLDITFADYQIEKPNSFMVLSVDDHGILELQLLLTEA